MLRLKTLIYSVCIDLVGFVDIFWRITCIKYVILYSDSLVKCSNAHVVKVYDPISNSSFNKQQVLVTKEFCLIVSEF